jgi:hypothetical protein
LIKEIQNQRLNWKRRAASETEITKIMGQIEENWKINGQLGVNLYKLKIKNWIGKDTELWGWQLILAEVKLHDIKS